MAFKHKQSGPPLHVYICTPAYNGQVDDAFAQSLAEAAFCCPMYNIQITAGIIGNVGFIELARNIFVKKFLEEYPDCTHLFFIDGDLQFESRAFVGLVRSGLPICAGIYRRRQAHEDYPFKPAENPDGGGLWFIQDWLQCERVPTGFLCISRKVLEEMAAEAPVLEVADQPGGVPWLFDLKKEPVVTDKMPVAKTYGEAIKLRAEGKDVAGGFRLIGEDYTFCDKYREKYGKNVPVWTNFDFKHHGFQGNFYQYLIKKQEAGELIKHDGGVVTRADGNTSSAA
jgi:hypothetical protein